MESYYEVNVSRRVGNGTAYSHLFATAPRSGVTEREIKKVLREILSRFESPEFRVDVTHWEGHGSSIDPTSLAIFNQE